jgi:hypothetical protein
MLYCAVACTPQVIPDAIAGLFRLAKITRARASEIDAQALQQISLAKMLLQLLPHFRSQVDLDGNTVRLLPVKRAKDSFSGSH